MRLYIDLNKALSQVSATGTDQKDGKRAVREHEESFSRDHSGVAGGDPSTDKPEVGGKWSHSDDEKSDSEVLKDGDKTKKAQEAIQLLKSFSTDIQEQLSNTLPNEREIEYLIDVCGYAKDDIMKGRARIVGRERDNFNNWLHQRLHKSIGRLLG